jgi:hypothetical protein
MTSIPHSTAPDPARDADASSGTASNAADWSPLHLIESAHYSCCCPAKPQVMAVMPPAAPGGEPVDLLLCGHHFRMSRDALQTAGAVVFDAAGTLLMPMAWEPAAACTPSAP